MYVILDTKVLHLMKNINSLFKSKSKPAINKPQKYPPHLLVNTGPYKA